MKRSLFTRLTNLAQQLRATNRLAEAEPRVRRALAILAEFQRRMGRPHTKKDMLSKGYRPLVQAMAALPLFVWVRSHWLPAV